VEKFIFDTDATNVGIAGVLSQVQEGQKRVVACFSKPYPGLRTTASLGGNYWLSRRLFKTSQIRLRPDVPPTQQANVPEREAGM
jgi:hypothetical protein